LSTFFLFLLDQEFASFPTSTFYLSSTSTARNPFYFMIFRFPFSFLKCHFFPPTTPIPDPPPPSGLKFRSLSPPVCLQTSNRCATHRAPFYPIVVFFLILSFLFSVIDAQLPFFPIPRVGLNFRLCIFFGAGVVFWMLFTIWTLVRFNYSLGFFLFFFVGTALFFLSLFKSALPLAFATLSFPFNPFVYAVFLLYFLLDARSPIPLFPHFFNIVGAAVMISQ